MFPLIDFGMLNLKTAMKGLIGHSFQEKLMNTSYICLIYCICDIV